MNRHQNILDILKSDEFKKTFIKDLIKEQEEEDKEIDSLYNYINTFDNFEDYLEDLETHKEQYIKEHPDTYIDCINEEYILVSVAFKYGKIEVNNRLHEINDFISSFALFKGYYFGMMHGQGSYPWWQSAEECWKKIKENTTNNQLELF